MHVVTLTDSELRLASTVGGLRQIENVLRGRRDAHGASIENGWHLHIEGAAGELAFAKWSGQFWNGNLGDLDADDVGRTQVRTASQPDHRLILHKKDADDRAFVLVTGTAPTYTLRGWVWGREGKLPEYWADPAKGRPAFFVPQSVLRPMPAQPT